MKKSVVMMILIVYIASLCVVGFFGAKIVVHDKTVPVEDIIWKTEYLDPQKEKFGLTKDAANAKVRSYANADDPANELHRVVEYYYETTYKPGLRVVLTFETIPSDSSLKGVEYTFDKKDADFTSETVDNGKTLVLTFLEDELSQIFITVSSKDKNVSKMIYVKVKASSI